MPYHDTPNEELRVAEDAKDTFSTEFVTKMLWVLIPVLIGGVISMFSDFQQDVQIIMWAVMFMIVVFGLWTSNARKIRKVREDVERKRWDKLMDGLDEQFDRVDKRFDQIDERFALSEKSDRALLRSELISFHREWVEEKGFITLEALEYIDRIHDAYNAVGGNDTGDKLWHEIHDLPIRENRSGREG